MKKKFGVTPRYSELSEVFGMANLVSKKLNLPVTIWSEHKGILRSKPDAIPRAKVETVDGTTAYSVSLEPDPKILAKSKNITKSQEKALELGRLYVGRNYETFLKHYNDIDDSFDDEDFFNELRYKGEYKWEWS